MKNNDSMFYFWWKIINNVLIIVGINYRIFSTHLQKFEKKSAFFDFYVTYVILVFGNWKKQKSQVQRW